MEDGMLQQMTCSSLLADMARNISAPDSTAVLREARVKITSTCSEPSHVNSSCNRSETWSGKSLRTYGGYNFPKTSSQKNKPFANGKQPSQEKHGDMKC